MTSALDCQPYDAHQPYSAVFKVLNVFLERDFSSYMVYLIASYLCVIVVVVYVGVGVGVEKGCREGS